jgi:thioredoxin-related protein
MNKSLFITFLSLPFFLFAGDKTKVKFYKGQLKADLKEVKSLAKAEDKFFILQFTATWCSPCKWMEETTFNDPNLADYMGKNYLAVKVDIDDIEGFDLKDRMKVEVLPTIIIFDASGKQLGRFAESMGPTKLLDNLKRIRENQIKRTPLPPTDVPLPKPTPKPTPKPVDKPADVKKPKKVIYAPGTGLYKMDVSRNVSTGFTVQVCSFVQYENVIKKYEELVDMYGKSVLIFIELNAGKPTYKMLVGEFKTKAEAEKFKKAKIPDGYIRDISTMK